MPMQAGQIYVTFGSVALTSFLPSFLLSFFPSCPCLSLPFPACPFLTEKNFHVRLQLQGTDC